ncbi:MAG: AI-2E family transporter [Acidobacteria bacterium]|nr:AI-2E family transporter [Acidobacteriota bacterium]
MESAQNSSAAGLLGNSCADRYPVAEVQILERNSIAKEPTPRAGIGYFLFFLVAFLTLTILLIWPVFPYVVVAVLLAYLFYPVNRRLQRWIPSAAVRAMLLTLVAVILFALPFVIVLQRLTAELSTSLQPERARQLIDNARQWLINHDAEMVASWISELIVQGRDYLVNSIPSFFGSVFHVSLGIFVCLFVFYYFTKEGADIWSAFIAALPLPVRLKSEMGREVTDIVQAIFFGQVLTALAQGALGGVGLLLFDIPQPVLLTVLMMLLSFFPFVGTPLVWGPAGALKIMAGDTWQGVGLLIYGAVVVMNVDNFLKPRLIAMHTQVHPVVILIGIIGGTQIFGFIGFLVGPVIFGIFLQLLRFFGEYRPAEPISTAEPSN